MQAVLLVSHGSKSVKARQEIDALAGRLAAQSGAAIFESAFLEIETPSIPAGLEACVKRGAAQILVLLNFLNSGRHVLEHIPALIQKFESSHPGIVCRVSPCVGSHEGMDRLYLDLIKQTPC